MTPFDPRLFRLLPTARSRVALLVITGVVQGLAGIAQAFAVSALIVAVAQGHPVGVPLRWTVLTLCLRGLAAGATEVAATSAGTKVSTRLRTLLCERHVSADADSRTETSRALTRAVQGTASIEPYLTRYLPTLVQAMVLPVAAVVAMAALDWPTAVIPVLTVPLLPVFAALIGSTTAQATSARWRTLSRLSGHFLDVMRGLPTLVGYGRALHQVNTVRRVSHDHRRATVATLKLAFLSSAALELLATLSVALVAVSVGIRLSGGSLPLEVAMPLILLAPEAYWPIRRVGAEFHAAADGAAALAEVLSELERPTPGHPERPDRATSARPQVVLDQVGYHFPGETTEILDGVSAVLPIGLTVVTGPSGAGKTTLVEIVAGLRRPSAGTLSAPAAHLVTQVPFLAPTTVRENLLLGAGEQGDPPGGARTPKPRSTGPGSTPPAGEPTDPAGASPRCRPGSMKAAALATALQRVGLSHAVMSLPDGLDTVLGDDGFGLSAGQRARLAAARALLSGRQVLLFDEPTAHLDPDTEAAVNETLRELAQDRVVVVVTHRRTLLAVADQVLNLPKRPPEAAPRESQRAAALPSPSSGRSATLEPDTDRRADPLGEAPPAGLRTAVLAGMAALCSGVALTATSGWLIVAASFRPQILTLMAAIAGVRAFGVARPVLRYVERVRSHDTALGWLADHRADLYAQLIPLTPARLGRRSRGDLLAGVVDDLDDVAYAQVRVTVPVLAMAGTGAAAAVLAAMLLPLAGAVMAAMVLGLVLAGLAEGQWERVVQARVVADRAAVARATTTLVTRAADVAAVGGAARMIGHLARAQRPLARSLARQGRARAAGTLAVPLLVASAMLMLTPLVVDAVTAGLGTPLAGLLLLLPVALGEVGSGLPDAAGAWARSRSSRERLAELVSRRPAVVPGPEALGTGAGTPSWPADLELAEVTASWDGARVALPTIDLVLPPGHHLAVIGANGSGKSTLLAVLARHLDPWSGRYTLAGHDVTKQPLSRTRASVAFVDDEPHVFASTVRENLRLARPGADDRDLYQALEVAGLGPWAAGLPDGLDTLVGAGGRGVSGGERARLALARAVVSQRPVILLDEPVAHLDESTARAVLRDLHSAARGRTMVLVTHRPEGVVGVDEVRDLSRCQTAEALPAR